MIMSCKQYGLLVKITSHNLPVSSANLFTATKAFFRIEMQSSADPYNNKANEMILKQNPKNLLYPDI